MHNVHAHTGNLWLEKPNQNTTPKSDGTAETKNRGPFVVKISIWMALGGRGVKGVCKLNDERGTGLGLHRSSHCLVDKGAWQLLPGAQLSINSIHPASSSHHLVPVLVIHHGCAWGGLRLSVIMPTNRQEVLAAAADEGRKDAAQLPRHSHTVNVVYWRPMLTVRLCLGGCQPSNKDQVESEECGVRSEKCLHPAQPDMGMWK